MLVTRKILSILIVLLLFNVARTDDYIVATIAGTGSATFTGDNGDATSATLKYPWAAYTDTSYNVYVADRDNHRIRKITISTGIISTVVGTGTAGFSGDTGQATSASLQYPTSVVLDASGTIVHIRSFKSFFTVFYLQVIYIYLITIITVYVKLPKQLVL